MKSQQDVNDSFREYYSWSFSSQCGTGDYGRSMKAFALTIISGTLGLRREKK